MQLKQLAVAVVMALVFSNLTAHGHSSKKIKWSSIFGCFRSKQLEKKRDGFLSMKEVQEVIARIPREEMILTPEDLKRLQDNENNELHHYVTLDLRLIGGAFTTLEKAGSGRSFQIKESIV